MRVCLYSPSELTFKNKCMDLKAVKYESILYFLVTFLPVRLSTITIVLNSITHLHAEGSGKIMKLSISLPNHIYKYNTVLINHQ